MADGSIRIDVGMDTSKATKELAKLERKIAETEKKLTQKRARRDELKGLMGSAYGELDAAKERVNFLKDKVSTSKGDTKKLYQEELADAREEQSAWNKEAGKLSTEYDRVVKDLSDGERSLADMKSEAGALRSEIEAARPGEALANGIDQARQKMMQFLKYALGIRSVFILFRRLISVTKESVKAFAQNDAETQQSINNLKNALSTLKASWGAAFAPILNTVAPILQKLISIVTKAINWINMLFSALSGKTTYKTAVANNNDLADSYSAAGDAAEEAERQLMGFDEINKLESPNSGGGGGSPGSGTGTGLETIENAIDPKILEHLNLIKDAVEAIGLGLAAWKIAKWFTNDLSKIAGISLSVAGSFLEVKGASDAWVNGVNWDNLIEILGGAAILATGLGIAFGTTAAGVSLLISGIAMLVIGIREWIQTGELSTQTFLLLEGGILAVGIAFSLLTGSWIPILIAAIAGLVFAIVTHWDGIKEKTAEIWEKIKSAIAEKIDNIKEKFGDLSDKIDQFKSNFAERMDSVKSKIEEVRAWFGEKIQAIKDFWAGLHFDIPHINLPHFTISGGFSLMPLSVPHISVAWYARGGIVDSPTLFGAGEAGKEAVIPLERNTEWINTVADGILQRLKNNGFAEALADAFINTPMPAMAMGTVVPPNSSGGAFSSEWTNSILDEIKSLRSEISRLASQPMQVSNRMYLDKNEIGRSVTEYQRGNSRATGR